MEYINYRGFSIIYDEVNHMFTFIDEKMGHFLKNGKVTKILFYGRTYKIEEYKNINIKDENLPEERKLIIEYKDGPKDYPNFNIEVLINKEFIQFAAIGYGIIQIEGELYWGKDPEYSTFAVSLGKNGKGLRTAHGPAASKIDNALYDRITDSVCEIKGCDKLRLGFDWDKNCYNLTMTLGEIFTFNKIFKIYIYDNYYREKFSVPFKPINKNHQFKTPPVGWMTWYAVQFKASNETVLKNARWLSKKLKNYGANCIWIDWEWYNSGFTSKETEGIDTFNPNKERYPKGLKYISDEIKKLGLIPAIWIGATNAPNKNKFIKNNPQWILANQKEWCGQWWIDPSNPDVVNEYIPKIFNQLLDWGYEVFKWDCLPASLRVFDEHHEKFYNPQKSSETALREVIKAGRNVIGEDKYMMSCCGDNTRDICLAADYFDGARIGSDVFLWEDFISEVVKRTYKYYVYHNVLWYADADNLVLRGEYNNIEQARSRTSFYAITGLPITLGDNLPALEKDRVELIKKILPVIDIHPMDLYEINEIGDPYILVNLNVANKFSSFNVFTVINNSEKDINIRLNLDLDLLLDVGDDKMYALYDFWDENFLGVKRESIDIDLPPFGSKVISVNEIKEIPQVISTSRHITQGAYEIEDLYWDPDRLILIGRSNIIGGEKYRVAIFIPDGFSVLEVNSSSNTIINSTAKQRWIFIIEFNPNEDMTEEWFIKFGKE